MATATATRPSPVAGTPRRRDEALPTPADADPVVWPELARLFHRYDVQAGRHRAGYLTLRLVVLVVGVAVTVVAAIDAPPAVVASLAAIVVVAEGAQQLFQLHTRSVAYRTAAETLRRENFLYVAGLAPYDDPATRLGRLAAFVQDITPGEYNEGLQILGLDGTPAAPSQPVNV
jgi:hypothetical protein